MIWTHEKDGTHTGGNYTIYATLRGYSLWQNQPFTCLERETQTLTEAKHLAQTHEQSKRDGV